MALLSLCSLLSLAALPAPAQQLGFGVSVGPFGGSLQSIAVDPADPDRLLASSIELGLVRSTDSGQSFAPFGSGLPTGGFAAFVRTLEPDPDDAGRWLCSVDANLYVSTDGGAHWTPTGFTADGSLTALAPSPDGDSWLATTNGTVYVSLDDGASFAPAFAGNVQAAISWAPLEPGVAYVGTFNGVVRSTNGGLSFANPGTDTTWAQAVLADPLVPGRVYLGGCCGIVRRSENGGQTWSPLPSPQNSSAQFLRADPNVPGRIWFGLLAAIYSSDTGGTSWSPANAGLPASQPILTDLALAADGERFLAAEGGVFRALAPLASPWVQVGLPTVELWDVEVVGVTGQRLVANAKGLHQSASVAVPLQQSAWFFDFGAHTNDVVVDPQNPGRWLLAGVGAFIDNATVRVLTNGGANVATPVEVFGAGQATSLEFDPFDPDHVVASFSPAGFGASGLMQSFNGGNNWSNVAGTVGQAVAHVALDPHQFGHWIALRTGGGFAETTNGGASFVPKNSWNPSGSPVFVQFDPHRAGFVYAADDVDGLWRSANGGNTWALVRAGGHDRADLEFHPTVPAVCWFGDALGQLWLSGDGGDSFTEVWQSPAGAPLAGLALQPDSGAVLVATLGESAYDVFGTNPFLHLGGGSVGTGGVEPLHLPFGGLPELGNGAFGLQLESPLAGATAVIHLGLNSFGLPFAGGVLQTGLPTVVLAAGLTDLAGTFSVAVPVPLAPGLAGLELYSQGLVVDAAAVDGLALSDGLAIRLQP
jgi:photosystem II stability/assembly factor-like uncharacterized protein